MQFIFTCFILNNLDAELWISQADLSWCDLKYCIAPLSAPMTNKHSSEDIKSIDLDDLLVVIT